MKLPHADSVRIDEEKVRDYLLSPVHPVGRFKARVFAAVGFDARNADAFVAELRRLAAVGEVGEIEDIPFGRKYTVPGELVGPIGSTQVLTVWFQEPAAVQVRLVTVRPR